MVHLNMLRKLTCASPPLAEVFPLLPLEQFQCSSEWWCSLLILSKDIIKHYFILCLSLPGDQCVTVWCPWLGVCKAYLKILNTSVLPRCKPPLMVAFPTSLSARSFPFTLVISRATANNSCVCVCVCVCVCACVSVCTQTCTSLQSSHPVLEVQSLVMWLGRWLASVTHTRTVWINTYKQYLGYFSRKARF